MKNSYETFIRNEEKLKNAPPWLIKDLVSAVPARLREVPSSKTTWGILDFKAMPYALGDCLTWQMNLMCTALENKSKHIKIIILCDPKNPSNQRLQPHIKIGNYPIYLERLKEAFFCIPKKHSVSYENDRYLVFKAAFLSQQRPGLKIWPPLLHLGSDQIDYMSHQLINSFYERYRKIPFLGVPTTPPSKKARQLAKTKTFKIFIHLRNSKTTTTPANTYRDADEKIWLELIDIINKMRPSTEFWYAGSTEEIFKKIKKIRNVVSLRSEGLTLKDELFLMRKANIFLGSMSGFAMHAIYSKIPYVITKLEKKFEFEMIGSSKDKTKFPFANNKQKIFWETEDFIAIKNEIYKLLK